LHRLFLLHLDVFLFDSKDHNLLHLPIINCVHWVEDKLLDNFERLKRLVPLLTRLLNKACEFLYFKKLSKLI
jgi:hypothetical protein